MIQNNYHYYPWKNNLEENTLAKTDQLNAQLAVNALANAYFIARKSSGCFFTYRRLS